MRRINFRDYLNIAINILLALTLHTKYSIASDRNLDKFNKSLESIGFYLRDNDKYSACKEANKALNILTLEKENLIKIEPNYNWLEIENVLNSILNKGC